MAIVELKRKILEVGRIRMGDKGTKGEPRKLDKFRLTSANRGLLEDASRLLGGTVQSWKPTPKDAAQWELYVEVDEIPVWATPDEPSMHYEEWSAGGCAKRCNGEFDSIRDCPCDCDPEARKCKLTTRVNFIIPDLPTLGVWRLESKGYNTAAEFTTMYEALQRLGPDVPAAIAIVERSSIVDGKTKRFIVPELRVKQTYRMLKHGELPALPDARPALPSGAPERVQEAVKSNERGDYAGATGARAQPPKQAAPRPAPQGQTVLEPEIVDEDSHARAQLAALFIAHAKDLGWEKKTQVAFLRETLEQPDLKSMDAINAPQWDAITNLTGQACQDRRASLDLWDECCDLWGVDSTDTVERDKWFAECLNIVPQPLSVYTPAQWARVKENLCAAKSVAIANAESATAEQGDLFGEQ